MIPRLLLFPCALALVACDSGASPDTTGPATDGSTSMSQSEDDGSGEDTATATTGSPQTSTTDPSTTSATTGPGTTDPTNPTETTVGDTTTDPTTGSGGGEDDSTGEPAQPPPPVGEADLLPWVMAGNYTQWAAEAAQHPSAGPHFTAVRTFVNDIALTSLEAGNTEHPVGSALVKELYGNAPEIGGWAVMIKTQAGAGADTWYWYEWFEGSTFADGNGVSGCGNCHSAGLDYIRTTLPL